MLLLAIETSSTRGGIALLDEGVCLREISFPEGLLHGREVTARLDEMLRLAGVRPASLGAIAVSVGPGSYTGIRVGVTAAKTLGCALGIPVVPESSLRVLAANAVCDAESPARKAASAVSDAESAAREAASAEREVASRSRDAAGPAREAASTVREAASTEREAASPAREAANAECEAANAGRAGGDLRDGASGGILVVPAIDGRQGCFFWGLFAVEHGSPGALDDLDDAVASVLPDQASGVEEIRSALEEPLSRGSQVFLIGGGADDLCGRLEDPRLARGPARWDAPRAGVLGQLASPRAARAVFDAETVHRLEPVYLRVTEAERRQPSRGRT